MPIWNRLSEVCSNSSDKARFIAEGMGSRAFAIKKLGGQAGHPIRDPAILEQRFFEDLDPSYEDAAAMQKNSPNLSTQDFLLLNRLKDRVRIMKGVEPQQVFCRWDELSRWYELLEGDR